MHCFFHCTYIEPFFVYGCCGCVDEEATECMRLLACAAVSMDRVSYGSFLASFHRNLVLRSAEGTVFCSEGYCSSTLVPVGMLGFRVCWRLLMKLSRFAQLRWHNWFFVVSLQLVQSLLASYRGVGTLACISCHFVCIGAFYCFFADASTRHGSAPGEVQHARAVHSSHH